MVFLTFGRSLHCCEEACQLRWKTLTMSRLQSLPPIPPTFCKGCSEVSWGFLDFLRVGSLPLFFGKRRRPPAGASHTDCPLAVSSRRLLLRLHFCPLGHVSPFIVAIASMSVGSSSAWVVALHLVLVLAKQTVSFPVVCRELA